MTLKNIIVLFGVFLLVFILQVRADISIDSSAVSKHEFSKSQWEKMTKDIDYSSDTAPRPGKKRSFGFSMNPDIVKTILFIGVGALLIFLLYKIMRGNYFARNKKISTSTGFLNIRDEENIQEMDLEQMYSRALEGKDYREAIRVKYLMAIRELSRHKIIHWKKEKTNHDYLTETFPTGIYFPFADITHIFERFWYGEAEINENKFILTVPAFDAFLSSIPSAVNAVENKNINSSNPASGND